LRRVSGDDAELQELIEELVVPETWFFRDAMAFRCVMRRLEAARNASRGGLRILSIGCSTGEETYSLAMLLRDAGLSSSQYLVLGSDISRRSLDFARKGVYTARSFRDTDEAFAASCQRWCERDEESRRVRDEVRMGVEFRWGNLSQPDFLAGEPPFDFVFCRNVLIYFHAAARRTVLDNVRRLLAAHGILCSAPAEARIFSEAGFHSLGRECPFAFRCCGEPAAEAVQRGAAVPAARAKAKAVDSPLIPHPSPQVRVERMQPTPSAATIASEPIPDLCAAERAADSGRLEEADALCGQILSRDPSNAAAHYLRGIVRKAQGALGEAQRSLERAIYLDSRHHEALVQMMLLAQQRGDQQAAANYRRRAEQAAPQEVK
jgi:chemotaxis protein methyltransferase WspC